MVDGAAIAGRQALQALGADTAAQAALRFGNRFFLGKRQVYFIEVIDPLFGGDPDQDERDNRREKGKPGHPVPEEEGLGQAPEKVGGVHGVADMPVDPVRNQLLPFHHFDNR